MEKGPTLKRIARQQASLQFPANSAVLLNDLDQTLRLGREVSRAHHRRHGIEVPAEEADEMIHVGDLTVNHPAPAQQATPQPSTLARLAPWLLGPLVGAGAIAGYHAMQPKPEPPRTTINVPAGTDTWYQYDIEPWRPGS